MTDVNNKDRRRKPKGLRTRKVDPEQKDAMRKPVRGREVIPSLDHFLDEGIDPLDTAGDWRFIQSVNQVDFQTAKAAIKTNVLNLVMMNLMTKSGIDKYDSAYLDSAEDVILLWAELIIAIRTKITMKRYVPAFTPNDAVDVSPWFSSSMHGFISELLNMHYLAVPYVSLAIADLFTIPVQLNGTSPNNGKASKYFYPVKPTLILSAAEAMIGTIAAQNDAITHFNRNKIPYGPPTVDMFAPREPVSIISTYNSGFLKYLPFTDDATKSFNEVDGNTDLYWWPQLGIGEIYEALALLRPQDAAGGSKWLKALVLSGAGKISAHYHLLSSTSGNAIDDTTNLMAYFDSSGSLTGVTNIYLNTTHTQPIPSKYALQVLANTDAWDNRLAIYLTKHADGSPPKIATLPVLQDRLFKPVVNQFSNKGNIPGGYVGNESTG